MQERHRVRKVNTFFISLMNSTQINSIYRVHTVIQNNLFLNNLFQQNSLFSSLFKKQLILKELIQKSLFYEKQLMISFFYFKNNLFKTTYFKTVYFMQNSLLKKKIVKHYCVFMIEDVSAYS